MEESIGLRPRGSGPDAETLKAVVHTLKERHMEEVLGSGLGFSNKPSSSSSNRLFFGGGGIGGQPAGGVHRGGAAGVPTCRHCAMLVFSSRVKKIGAAYSITSLFFSLNIYQAWGWEISQI